MKSIIFGILGFTLLIASCEKPEQLGPDIKGIYGPLTVTQAFAVSNSSPDFSTGESIYFTAKFENDAIWTITITESPSGAKKTITGISKEIGAYNSSWTGNADDAPSFRVGETVTATLSFSNSTDTYALPINLIGVKDLDAGGVLVTDFNASQVGAWATDWPASGVTNNAYVKPDANEYMHMTGTPWQGTPVTPYVDFVTITAAQADVNYGTYFPLYADPLKVYFNLMVYNTGTTDTWLKIIIHEEGGVSREVDIRPDWVGWKLLSYNYTELVSASTAAGKPNKVTSVQFVLLSDAATLPGAAVSTAFDHVIFTHNKPYQP